LILWRNEVPRMSDDDTRWKVHSELTGLNPVKLKFRKSVRLPSDELVDVAVVKQIPKLLFLHRKVLLFGVFTAQQF
jgi:hypothetical protein